MVKWKINSIEEFKTISVNENVTRFEEREKVLNKVSNFIFFDERATSYDAFGKSSDIDPLDVEYFINEYGFRGDWSLLSDKKKILFVGCSFTLGWGLNYNDTFVKLISDELYPECEIINLSIAGCSMDTNLRYFKYVTDIVDIDTVIFLLPPPFRTEFPSKDPLTPLFNIVPQEENTPKSFKSKLISWTDLNTNEFMNYRTGKNISYIETICEFKNIKSYFTTYDIKLYHYLSKVMDDKKLLPFFEQLELNSKFGNGIPNLKRKFARDGSHPGKHSNKIFAEDVIKFINNEK
jgi:hypothetical protein